MEIPFYSIGKISTYLLIFTLLIILSAMAIGAYSYKKKKILFPGFVLFILDLFYTPSKLIAKSFSIRPSIIDEIMIEIINATQLNKFKKTKKRVLIGPHCLRHKNCPARCDSRTGYVCLNCGKCAFTKIKQLCDKYGYEMYIVPGSSFVKKIVKMKKPESAFGVACFLDLNELMSLLSHRLPVQGVALTKDGCFETEVNIEDIEDRMRLCENV